MTGSLPPSQESINEFVIAAHHDLIKVQRMLAQEPLLLNEPAQWSETPIQAAAHVGNRPIAEYLLNQGAPLDICTAAMLGQIETVRAMLNNDAELAHARGAHSIPVLFFAAISGHLEIADLLHGLGAEVNTGAGSNTPLHGAVLFGQQGMVEWLIQHGADVNTNDYNGKTSLTIALETHQAAIAGILRQHGGTEA